MLDYFAKDGKKSTDFGVYVEKLPDITVAEERAEYEEVIGRSGSLTMLQGDCVYEDLTLAADCWVRDLKQWDAFVAWLRGEGQLTFPNRPGGYYIGRPTNQIEAERVIAAREHRRFTITWRCRPYWYLDNSPDASYTASLSLLNNPGSAPSLPRIRIEGSGSFSMTIGERTMFFRDVEKGIIVDSELQDALTLDGAQLANDKVDGDFLEIPPGLSYIQWLEGGEDDSGGAVSGVVSRVTVTPRWRSL